MYCIISSLFVSEDPLLGNLWLSYHLFLGRVSCWHWGNCYIYFLRWSLFMKYIFPPSGLSSQTTKPVFPESEEHLKSLGDIWSTQSKSNLKKSTSFCFRRGWWNCSKKKLWTSFHCWGGDFVFINIFKSCERHFSDEEKIYHPRGEFI